MVIDQLFEDWMGLKELKSLKTILTKCYGTTTNLHGVTIPFMLNDVKGREMVRNYSTKKEGETI
jgi:hypothetical protein